MIKEQEDNKILEKKYKGDNLTLQECILDGVNTLADTVGVTFGAKGRLVLFNNKFDMVAPTKDGATVAEHVHSENPYSEMAIKVIREASKNTVLSSGDGTSSTILLARQLVLSGMEALASKSVSYYEYKKGTEQALTDIVKLIQKNSIDITKKNDALEHIATTSGNDIVVGKTVAKIFKELGNTCDIDVQEDLTSEVTTTEIVKGMRCWKGYISSNLINNKVAGIHEHVGEGFEGNFILVYNGTIRDFKELLPFIHLAKEYERGLLVFCDNINSQALRLLENFVEMQKLNVCLCSNDGFGDNKLELMNDICVLTGCSIINENMSFADVVNPEVLFQVVGECGHVKATETHTYLMNCNPDPELLANQIAYVKSRLESASNTPYQLKFNKKRFGYLTAGVSVIKVGATTVMAMKELKDRYDDAVLAAKSAVEAGICYGGCYTWLAIYDSLKAKFDSTYLNRPTSFMIGYNNTIDSLRNLFTTLLENSDLLEIESKLVQAYKEKQAFDLKQEKLVPIKDYKVYDSAAVLKDSITNAVTVSNTMLGVKKMIFDGIVK